MKQILIYGPYAEEYSLAKVNREFAHALGRFVQSKNQPYQVKVGADPAHIARVANDNDRARYPFLKDLAVDFDPGKTWDLIIYNNFPKDPNALHGLQELNAKVKAALIAWEEDRFPQRWVDEYNSNLHVVLAATTHTQRILKRSGVTVPIIVIPNAVTDSFLKL